MFPTRRITLGGDKFRDEYSLSFDGTNDYVDCGSDSSLDVGTSDFTACAWFKVISNGYSHAIIAKGTSLDTGNGWAISFFQGDMNIYLDTGDGTTRQGVDTANNSIEYNKWHHVAATRSNSTNTLKLYLDGVFTFENSIATNDDLGDSSIPFEIGSSANNRYLNGNVSDVAYYNTALTSSQIKTIYNGREPYNHKEGVASGSLVSWWRMGDGALDGFNLIGDETDIAIGNELVATGDFSSNTGWETTGTWVIADNKCTHSTGTNDANQIRYAGILTSGKVYKVSYDIVDYTSGEVRIDCGDFGAGTERSGIGSYSEYIVSTNTFLDIEPTGAGASTFIGAIDNVSVKEVSGNAGVMTNMASDDFTGDTP